MKARNTIFFLFCLMAGALPCAAQEPVYPSLKREVEQEEEYAAPSPREIIMMLDTTERYIPGASHRTVDDYKARVNDPARRFKLTSVAPGTRCDVCDLESALEKNAEEEFYLRSGDDKILITLFNKQEKATFVDLPPNSVYGIYMETFTLGGGGGLPMHQSSSDVRQKMHTNNFVKINCAPKLSELGDEYYINHIYFERGKAELSKDGSRELDRVAVVAIKNPGVDFWVEAYADESGAEEHRRKLSARRLERILGYLERRGVDMSRIIGHSYATGVPLIEGAVSEDEHYLNRCATVRLISRSTENSLHGDTTYTAVELPVPEDDKVAFMVRLGSFAHPLDDPAEYFADVVEREPRFNLTYHRAVDGYYKYHIGGVFRDIDDARILVRRILKYRECYVAAFYKGQRITVYEALKVLEHFHKNGGQL